MKHLYTFNILLFVLTIYSGCEQDKALIEMGSNKIKMSDLYTSIDQTVFENYDQAKKLQFVKKYSIIRYLQMHPATIEDFNFTTEHEKIKNDLIISEVEKDVFNELQVSDSITAFVAEALNVDKYVKGLTVSHMFSFGLSSERTEEEALVRANKIYNRLLLGDITFEEAMSIYGELDVSKIKGNDFGRMHFGYMPKSFNDIVWTSQMGQLYEPIETPFGYHVVIVDHSITKYADENKKTPLETIESDLKKGRYGYMEEHFMNFMDELHSRYNMTIDQKALYEIWDSAINIEGVKTMSGIKIEAITRIAPELVIGQIGNNPITLTWINDTASKFNYYNEISINSGYTFEKTVKDVINRYLLLFWFKDNEPSGANVQIRYKTTNQMFRKFLDYMTNKNPDLTKEIIINRFLMNNEISINHALFAEDISE